MPAGAEQGARGAAALPEIRSSGPSWGRRTRWEQRHSPAKGGLDSWASIWPDIASVFPAHSEPADHPPHTTRTQSLWL